MIFFLGYQHLGGIVEGKDVLIGQQTIEEGAREN